MQRVARVQEVARGACTSVMQRIAMVHMRMNNDKPTTRVIETDAQVSIFSQNRLQICGLSGIPWECFGEKNLVKTEFRLYGDAVK